MNKKSSFLIFAKITLVTTYLVILAGAIVRTTGSGMGCPDWPKCFGKWVPPTDESQLPPNYQEIYKDRGYADTAFNVYHTWTEYANRLIGALLGIFVVILFIASLKYRRGNKILLYLCGAAVLLVGFQGWLGSVVVSSNLAPVKISIHMLVALLIVALFIYIIHKSSVSKHYFPIAEEKLRKIKNILFICILFSVIQILIGTKVRERVDVISFSMDYEFREKWVLLIGSYLEIHRLFAIVVIALNIYLFRIIQKSFAKTDQIRNYTKRVILFLLLEVLLGVILTRYSFPAFAQPIHLLLASVIFGIQFYILIMIMGRKQIA